MKVSLNFSNDRLILSSVRAFVYEALLQLPLDDDAAAKLVALTSTAVEHAIEHAYPAGEEGAIELGILEQQGKLQITVRDFGLPQDSTLEEQRLHASDHLAKSLFGQSTEGAVDEIHWQGFGPQGKALQLIKWLHDTHVQSASDSLTAFGEEPPLAPEQAYEIRRMLPKEAAEVSRLIYRAYGNTYFNEDVYYPERLAAQNEHGALVSFVAVAADGEVVGHYALEFDQAGPVAECGQAVVNPAHRKRGLMNRMKDAALAHAAQLDLMGWYADAVCVHPYTQKSNAELGGKLAAVELGISPQTESFRGLSEKLTERVTCILYFHWLKPPGNRTLYVNHLHRDIVARIYENLGCPCAFGNGLPPEGHGVVSTTVTETAGLAVIRVEKPGADTARDIKRTKRQLVEHAKAAAVFVELPLSDPGTPDLIEQLETAGFGFAGVAPHFAASSDMVKLVYLVEPLSRGPIQVFEPFGQELVDYVLAEQARVREQME